MILQTLFCNKNEIYIWILTVFVSSFLTLGKTDCPRSCHCEFNTQNSNSVLMRCRNNSFNYIPDTKFSNAVEYLDLSLYRLDFLKNGSFKNYPILSVLYLLGCNIDKVEANAFENLNSVSIINLSNNKIHYLHPETFENLRSLETLILKKNPFKVILGPFIKSSSLRTLDLSKCNLTAITNDAFSLITKLEMLNIYGNMLEDLQVSPLTKLNSSEMGNNFWMCNCQLKNISSWLSKSFELSVVLKMMDSPFCCHNAVGKYEGTIWCSRGSSSKAVQPDCFTEHMCFENRTDLCSEYEKDIIIIPKRNYTLLSSYQNENHESRLKNFSANENVSNDSETVTHHSLLTTEDRSINNHTDKSLKINVTEEGNLETEPHMNVFLTLMTANSSDTKLEKTDNNDVNKNRILSRAFWILCVAVAISVTISVFLLGIMLGLKCHLRHSNYSHQPIRRRLSDIEHEYCTIDDVNNKRWMKCL